MDQLLTALTFSFRCFLFIKNESEQTEAKALKGVQFCVWG